jgi:pheromone receptor transcription factor
MNMDNKRKKSVGHKKIEIKKIDKASNRQVTFSKRRQGLFKKASELCVLCDAHVAMVVFSPSDKPFCFGQPNAETILNSYINETTEFEDSKSLGNSSTYEEYNRQYEALKMLELEKKKLADVKNLNKGDWWNDSIDDMSIEELEQFMVSIKELKSNLDQPMLCRTMEFLDLDE